MASAARRPIGELLREWRQRRRLSQLDLACEADISQRHVSFLESGRARPSREMVMHLAERLEVPLRERNVLLVGSGSISHNLRAVFSSRPGEDRLWVDRFTSWLEEAVRAGARERLLSALEEAPEAARNHPTDEHLLPLFFAAGAGGARGVRLHHSYTYDVLAMDAFAFGEPALLERLASDVETAEHER